MIKAISAASALGNSSRNTWLKVPYCEGFGSVAASTTLPILILGGGAVGSHKPYLKELEQALASGYNVRGALVGRNILYPGEGNPYDAAKAVGELVHG